MSIHPTLRYAYTRAGSRELAVADADVWSVGTHRPTVSP
jgi:hypothetical protein